MESRGSGRGVPELWQREDGGQVPRRRPQNSAGCVLDAGAGSCKHWLPRRLQGRSQEKPFCLAAPLPAAPLRRVALRLHRGPRGKREGERGAGGLCCVPGRSGEPGAQALLPDLTPRPPGSPCPRPHTHPSSPEIPPGTCYLSAQSLRGRPGRRGGTCWNLHPPELNETRSEISKIHF